MNMMDKNLSGDTVGVRTVDHNRGTTNGVVSSQWWRRPADQRFLNLSDLYAAVKRRADTGRVDTIESKKIEVIAERGNPTDMSLKFGDVIAAPTNWSFGQICSLVGAPGGYLRNLPAPIAAINLQFGLQHHRAETVKIYSATDDTLELRAITGPDYGRIFDHEVVDAVMKVAGNGDGDTIWKVPGMMDWSKGTYDPNHPVSLDTTTLYASDRDVFIFLVDDLHPIEVGLLSNGDPDYVFRGFVISNSETGSRALAIQTFYLRGVCQNRMIWGMEGFQEIKIRHSKFASDRFAAEATPALASYANASSASLISGVKAAKDMIVARKDEDRVDWLTDKGFSKPQADKIIATVLREEGKEPESIWDFVQGVTAVARDIEHQDQRFQMEKLAGRWMEKVAA